MDFDERNEDITFAAEKVECSCPVSNVLKVNANNYEKLVNYEN